MANADEMTDADVTVLRAQYFIGLDLLSDDQLRAAVNANSGLVGLGRQWAWTDTEVRDRTGRAIEVFLGAPDLEDWIAEQRGTELG